MLKLFNNDSHKSRHRQWLTGLMLSGGLLAASAAQAATITVDVVGSDGSPVTGFRWLVEQDNTHPVTPGTHTADILSFDFHRSHAPVVASGNEAPGSGITVPDNDRYFVSVLPYSGYSMNGAAVEVGTGTSNVTITVNQLPIPTATISIFAYEDNMPTNNAPDLPGELPLAGFSVILEDAGGLYGIAGGPILADAFGNPLGTTYLRNPDGSYIPDPADGISPQVDVMGDGQIVTDADGRAIVRNIAPGKYGVLLQAPPLTNWVQTHTIEGSPVIDAWVKANEPAYFQEFGPPGHHVFIGFVQESDPNTNLGGTATVSGQVTKVHNSRPPAIDFFSGAPVGECYVALNNMADGSGEAVFVQACDANSNFSFPNVPEGVYRLGLWDKPLTMIFGQLDFTVDAAGDCYINVSEQVSGCNFGQVPIFSWFHRLESATFADLNENGFWNNDEPNLPADSAGTVVRFRNGAVYQDFPIDGAGEAPFDKVFPFMHWLVAESYFTNLKATGATYIVDDGGDSQGTEFNPQPQPDNGGADWNTLDEEGLLTLAFQGFLGTTNVIEWGKTAYAPGENGGISGIVFYATTRAEDDPRYAAAEEWETGIPGVTVNLYADFDNDGDPDGGIIATTTTDSWDDSLPTGCVQDAFDAIPELPGNEVQAGQCYDGLRNYNQIRGGVFDGGYAFTEADLGNGMEPLPGGRNYIVEVIAPAGYELVREEDKNVDFGDVFVPSPLVNPPACVGDLYTVPPYLSMETIDDGYTLIPGLDPEDAVSVLTDNGYAGTQRPECDQKQVLLADRKNAAADFFLFTQAPKAARVVGFMLNDLGNEFDPNSPNFGEKFAPPWLPVSIRDWTGSEIVRTVSDEFGKYNALLPSTSTQNLPIPSGASPNMLTACMNAANDPLHDNRYSQFCYTFQFMPGTTTYLDTPVVPVSAFAGADQFPLDCEFIAGTPLIESVIGLIGGAYAEPGESVTINSLGLYSVPNPAYDGSNARMITRDYGFGAIQGTLVLRSLNGGADLQLDNLVWTDAAITGDIPAAAAPGQYHLAVTHDNGTTSDLAVSMTIGAAADNPTVVLPGVGTPIQDAIDNAAAGDVIVVTPGTYEELVIMHKPVILQGAGAFSTVINAVKAPSEKLQDWRDKAQALLNANEYDLLEGQEAGFDPLGNEPLLFLNEEGAGISVLANQGEFNQNTASMIDGFSITGSDSGGAIFVNGNVDYLTISNNRLISNFGWFGGGVRVGHRLLIDGANNYVDASNDNITIRNNQITQNGATEGAGGGVSLYTGTDNYEVTNNFICGNFTQGHGAGIGHYGLSDNGLIQDNVIAFNQSFAQDEDSTGGGIFIGGLPSLEFDGFTTGAGSVKIDRNQILGNNAGAGDGGGIRLANVNGFDVFGNPPSQWHRIDVTNNFIGNNVTGLAGGGISLVDTVNAYIMHNTIANNDSTATAGAALPNPNSPSLAQEGVGIASHVNTNFFLSFATGIGFSDPEMMNNIVWHNRMFQWSVNATDGTGNPVDFGLIPDIGNGDAPVYNDIAVTDGPGLLTCVSCITSVDADPLLVNDIANTGNGETVQQVETKTSLATAAAFDEGGNYIDVRYGPLTLDPASGIQVPDYHRADDANDGADVSSLGIIELAADIDEDTRNQATPEIGADEILTPVLEADLSVAMTDSADPVNAGDPVTLNITVNNGGPDAASNILASISLPACATLTGTTGCSPDGSLSCNLGTIASGGSSAFTATMDTTACSGTISSSVTVAADEIDPVAANNSVSESTVVNVVTPDLEADLSVALTDSADPVTAGDPVTLNVTVNNGGPDAASNVVATITLPACATLTGTTGCSPDGSLSCNLGTITAAGSAAFTATMDTTGCSGTVSSSVSVSATETDPAGGNNTATENTTVNTDGGGGPGSDSLYFSMQGNDPVPGVASPDDADIYSWDGSAFARVMDASGAGLAGTADVDGLSYNETTGEVCVSFNNSTSVPGIAGTVQDEDIVCLNGTTWSMYFDGSTQGLNTSGNLDIDAFDIVGNVIYFSTTGNVNPPGVAGDADDGDIYSWDGTNFARVFDATADAGLPGNADIDALSYNGPNDFCVSFNATVSGTVGTDEDAICYNGSTWTLLFDGSANGLTATSNDMDALDTGAGGGSGPGPVAQADLSVAMNDSADPVTAGDPVTLNVTVNNGGPDAASNVLASISLPACATLTGTTGCSPDGGLSCNLGTIASAGSAAFTATMDTTGCSGTVSSSVSVSATETDPAGGNNTATENTTVNTDGGGGPGPAPAGLYFSMQGNDAIPGVTAPHDDADVYSWDGSAFGQVMDASGAGLAGTADVDGLSYNETTGEVCVSFNNSTSVPGIAGTVQDEDIVCLNGTTWSMYFDGSTQGLNTSGNLDIDAFDIVGNVIYFSTTGNVNPPGVAGNADDGDIYSWDGTNFARVFDATADAGLPGNADIDALSYNGPNDFCVSFNATVSGTVGTDEDAICYNGSTWTLLFDGSANGLTATSNDMDALDTF